jgi:TolA-binding protein
MKYYLALSLALFLVSCGANREQSLQDIKEAENNLYANEGAFLFNDSLANITLEAYLDYVSNFPQDSLSADYLFKAADLYRAKHEFDKAIATFDRVAKDYPAYEKVPQTVFLQGFIYENDLKDLPKAKERYEFFIQQYPQHQLARDVQFSLNNLGKTPEQIIQEFQQNQILQDSLSSLVDSTAAAQ